MVGWLVGWRRGTAILRVCGTKGETVQWYAVIAVKCSETVRSWIRTSRWACRLGLALHKRSEGGKGGEDAGAPEPGS
jgi:hypothetical protein